MHHVTMNNTKFLSVLNSAINPLSYAFFKRDIKKEFNGLIDQVPVFKYNNQVEPSTYTLEHS